MNRRPFMFFVLCVVVLLSEVNSFKCGLLHRSRVTLKFFAEPKNIPKSKDKVRVQLLEDVDRIGYKDDVVLVSKEQHMNILLPRRVSKIVKDEDTAVIEKSAVIIAARNAAEQKALIANIASLPILEVTEKAGRANLRLYRSLLSKPLIDILRSNLDPVLNKKITVKTLTLVDVYQWREETSTFQNMNFQKTGEIRFAGLYKLAIRLKGVEELLPVQLRIIPEILD